MACLRNSYSAIVVSALLTQPIKQPSTMQGRVKMVSEDDICVPRTDDAPMIVGMTVRVANHASGSLKVL